MRKPLRSATAAAFGAALAASAPPVSLADASVQSHAASWADTLAAWGVTASGYVAASYYASSGYPFNVHQFDTRHDSFQLDEAGLAVAYQPQHGFGALVDAIAGEDARVLNAAEGESGALDVRQAYLQYAGGPVTVIAGKFVTLAGAEVINPTQNTNFSRSLLFFYNEPLTHTGIRATLALTGTLALVAGVNNGWNVMSTDYGPKTGEAGIAWTPGKAFSLTAQAYFGKTQYVPGTTLAVDAERTLVDLVATYNATSALTFVLNVDWDRQDAASGAGTAAATWYGAAGYANYALSDRWRVSGRLEYLDDKDGIATGAPGGQHLWEGTLTLGYAPVKHFELRLEGRYDSAQIDTFYRGASAVAGLTPDGTSLSEVALQGVYKF